MTLTDLVLLALAVGGLVDVLLHGSLFASWRAHVEARGGWRAELLGCPYCLTYQAALWLALAWWLGVGLPVYVLAAARLCWVAESYLAGGARYTRPSL